MVEGLKALKKGLEEPDFTVLFRTCNNIAMVRWSAALVFAGRWICGVGAAGDLMVLPFRPATWSGGSWGAPVLHQCLGLRTKPRQPAEKPPRSSLLQLESPPGLARGCSEQLSPVGKLLVPSLGMPQRGHPRGHSEGAVDAGRDSCVAALWLGVAVRGSPNPWAVSAPTAGVASSLCWR